ncbi:NAD(P)/FAD-dependent oxidoreductase [Candidatus Bipolaricaulota bacterium]
MRIAVIGGGAVGALVARELARYESTTILFEREPDVGWGVTKANSAIVHGGFHDRPGTVRSRFCVSGNAMFEPLCAELGVPFLRTGAYVLAFDDHEASVLETLRAWGNENGATDLEIHSREQILDREPQVNPHVQAALWSPSVAITEPWGLAMAAVENAVENGVDVHLAEEITGIETEAGRVCAVLTNRDRYPVDAVVNAAGLFADRIAAMVGLPEPHLHPRRGEYILLDKNSAGLVNSVLFPTPNEDTKGILVLPTIDGGILLGPTAVNQPEDARGEAVTTSEGIHEVIEGSRRLVPEVNLSLVVKTFAGLRPESSQEDFVVGKSIVEGFYQAAAMRSPGLTAAPAIAQWLVRDLMKPDLSLKPSRSFRPSRAMIPRMAELSLEERDRHIRKDPRLGRTVCYCNEVSEGEVVDAIRRGARTLDGVKFRTRASFGRCQGASCSGSILRILARELQVEPEEIVQRRSESWILSEKART